MDHFENGHFCFGHFDLEALKMGRWPKAEKITSLLPLKLKTVIKLGWMKREREREREGNKAAEILSLYRSLIYNWDIAINCN